MDNLEKRVKKIEQEIISLHGRRILQSDVLPNVIKKRHMGEPNSYVNSGLAADKPTEGISTNGGVSIYFATDTNVLYIWNGTAWVSEILT